MNLSYSYKTCAWPSSKPEQDHGENNHAYQQRLLRVTGKSSARVKLSFLLPCGEGIGFDFSIWFNAEDEDEMHVDLEQICKNQYKRTLNQYNDS